MTQEELNCVNRYWYLKLCDDSNNHDTTSLGWWRGFKIRHGDKIVRKKGERFASTRSDWTKLSNILQMYNVVDDELVDACVESWRETPVYTDRHGNKVEESDPERFGWEQNVKIDYPNYLMFADKTGCITNMKMDSHEAGST